MRAKLIFTKNFGVKTTMEEIKAMAQEIWKTSILHPRRPKFNHHIKFRKNIMNSDVALKNFLTKHLCWSLFLIKIQVYSPANLLKRLSNTGVLLIVIAKFLRTAILRNICEQFLLWVLPFMLVWTFFYRNK